MKATIEFDLNDPDDQNRYEICNKALDMGIILWELIMNKRKELEDAKFPVDKLYNWLYIELEERGINIEKLIQ